MRIGSTPGMDVSQPASLPSRLRRHWPEYLIEAAGLGLFMLAVASLGTLLEFPGSPLNSLIPSAGARRALLGLGMGLTVVAVIYSPWGQRSGAHFNPSITLTYLRLGKVDPRDAIFYVLAQFVGGAAGLGLAALFLGSALAHPSVNYLATVPGAWGSGAAFAAEVAITFVLMLMVLIASNSMRLERYTGLFAGALLASYIFLVAPISGMSLNPARSLASALPAMLWENLWIYFTAPPLGMLLAAQVYLWRAGSRGVFCAKLNHRGNRYCIFHCGYHELSRSKRRT